MSTILDAIRKAEQQRNDEVVPSLEAIVSERRKAKSKRGRWLIWVALIAVLAIFWYFNQAAVSRWSQQSITLGQQWIDQGSGFVRGLTGSDQQDQKPAPKTQGAATAKTNQISQTEQADSRLSAGQRALLSQIKFSVISYSTDDNKRFAMVGSETLREGDLLEGFPIIKIQQDGVMLDVNGRAVLIRP